MTKTTVTVAIPAFNEASNIARVLTEILSQKQNGFVLENVIVLTDGSTDTTNLEVLKLSKKSKLIKLLSFKKRLGKVKRLNQIYKLNSSDILITLDGDIAIKDKYLISKVVEKFDSDKNAQVIAIHQIPIKLKGFIAEVIYTAYDIWNRTRLSVKNQDHIQNLYGAATGYRKGFVKRFRFPADITDDRGYLYIKAKELNGFSYLKSTRIYYLPVSTLKDFWKLGDRSFGKNREVLEKYFGQEVNDLYQIPLTNKLKAAAEVIFKHPLLGSLALLINLLTRLFPLHDKLYDSNMWEPSFSTKKKIAI